jgi:hypothetical protein
MMWARIAVMLWHQLAIIPPEMRAFVCIAPRCVHVSARTRALDITPWCGTDAATLLYRCLHRIQHGDVHDHTPGNTTHP